MSGKKIMGESQERGLIGRLFERVWRGNRSGRSRKGVSDPHGGCVRPCCCAGGYRGA